MRLIALFLGLFVAACGSKNTTLSQKDLERIINGEPVPIEEVPFQISLEKLRSHTCGGSIIDRDIIVTAAHCVASFISSDPIYNLIRQSPAFMRVRVGNDYVEVGGSLVKVLDFVVHPNNTRGVDYDIALIRLKAPLKFTNSVQPIEVARENPKGGEMAVITGFGTTWPEKTTNLQTNFVEIDDRSRHQPLLKVALPIVGIEKCREIMKKHIDTPITDRMVCAGYLNDNLADACKGDSGGPLTVNGKLVGLTSWGIGCGRKGLPGIYTNVVPFYKWIQKAKRDLRFPPVAYTKKIKIPS